MTPMFFLGFLLWLAVTGIFESTSLLVGLLIAFFLDRIFFGKNGWRKAIHFVTRTMMVLVKAYWESLKLVFSRDRRQGYFTRRIRDASSWGVFLEVFLVTLTPRTVSVHIDQLDEMLVHRFEEEEKKSK